LNDQTPEATLYRKKVEKAERKVASAKSYITRNASSLDPASLKLAKTSVIRAQRILQDLRQNPPTVDAEELSQTPQQAEAAASTSPPVSTPPTQQ
jgi:hypothetical protein